MVLLEQLYWELGYLTLTRVVFEFYSNLSNSLNTGYLTLTRVVFEYAWLKVE